MYTSVYRVSLLLLFSRSVMSDTLWLHGLQRARPPYPSPSPGVYSNWCTLSQWCHPTISALVVPFSSCLQTFSASGSFPMSWLLTSDGQNIGASASVSVLPISPSRTPADSDSTLPTGSWCTLPSTTWTPFPWNICASCGQPSGSGWRPSWTN